jgi:hypothetical protein
MTDAFDQGSQSQFRLFKSMQLSISFGDLLLEPFHRHFQVSDRIGQDSFKVTQSVSEPCFFSLESHHLFLEFPEALFELIAGKFFGHAGPLDSVESESINGQSRQDED